MHTSASLDEIGRNRPKFGLICWTETLPTEQSLSASRQAASLYVPSVAAQPLALEIFLSQPAGLFVFLSPPPPTPIPAPPLFGINRILVLSIQHTGNLPSRHVLNLLS